MLVDLAADQFPWLFSSIVVKTSYLKENRALLLRFMKATIEGNYLAVNDEKRGKEVLARELKLKEPKVIDIIYNDFKAGTPVTTEPTPQSIANILKYSGANTGKVSDYVDASLLDELKKSGFLDEMARKYAKK